MCAGRVGGLLTAVLMALCGGCADTERLLALTGWLQAESSRLSFGATTLGVPVDRTVRVSQRGRLAAVVTAVRLEPSDEGFELLQPVPHVMAPGSRIQLSFRYNPLKAGSHAAQLRVAVQDGPELVVALEGEGVDARVVSDPEVLFGRPALGAVRQRRITLRNTDRTPVPVRLQFVGADAAEFESASALSLTGYEKGAAQLRYAPVGRAGRRATALRLWPCPLCAPVDLPVEADAVPEPVVVSPQPLSLSTPVDTIGTLTVTVTNATDEPVHAQRLVLDSSSDAGLRLEGPPLPVLLPPLQPVALQLRFSPLHLGPSQGLMVVESDAVPVPRLALPITAEAGGAQLVVGPVRLLFRTTPVMSRQQAIVVVSNGGAGDGALPLEVTALTVEGAAFRVLDAPALPLTLRAGQRRELVVAFEPGAGGLHAGGLVVEASASGGASRARVALEGSATEAGACDLRVQPATLDFGGVALGRAAELGVRVTNVGAVPCALRDARLTGDEAFSLPRQRALVRIDPGAGLYVPVRFTPKLAGAATGLLSIDGGAAPVPVALSGGGGPSCLAVDPPYVSLGARRLDCGPVEQEVRLSSRCGALDLTSVRLGEGSLLPDPISLVSGPGLPRTLGQASVRIRFTPGDLGRTSTPLLLGAADSAWERLVTIDAESLPEARHTDRWVQPSPGKVDLLWVMDNTASMDDERAAIAGSIGRFLTRAQQRGVDWRMAVTTTGVGPAPGGGGNCPGGAQGDESGRFFPVDNSRARIVHPGLADAVTVLARNLDVGGCHSVEQGFDAARRALSAPLATSRDDARTPLPNDGNAGFLRPDAALAIVVVSDEDDVSPGSVAQYVTALRALKPESPVSFSAFVPPLGGCPSGSSPAPRYLEAVDALGGVKASVCEADAGTALDTLAEGLFVPRDTYVLSHPADEASLEVTIDARVVSGWRYDPATRALRFPTPPAPGAVLEVRYREPCP